MTYRKARIAIGLALAVLLTQTAQSQEVDGILSLSPPTPECAVAIRFEVGSAAISGVQWYHNDGTTPFPKLLLIEGTAEAPPNLTDPGLVLEEVTGASLSWGDIEIDPPVSSSTGIVDVVFEFPDEERSGTGEDSGPGLGYYESPTTHQAFVTGDGLKWATIHKDFTLAAQLIHSAQKTAGNAVLLSDLARARGGATDLISANQDRTDNVELAVAPNPFNPRVEISFQTPKAGFAQIDVFDVRGRHVARPLAKSVRAGPQTVVWSGNDKSGAAVASGVYFVELRIGDIRLHKSISLVR